MTNLIILLWLSVWIDIIFNTFSAGIAMNLMNESNRVRFKTFYQMQFHSSMDDDAVFDIL